MESKGIGPGKYYRRGLTLIELMNMLPNEDAAEQWVIDARWPYGIRCPRCGSDNVQEKSAHPHLHHRCRPCSRFFSAKTNTVMQRSKLGYRVWAIAIYLLVTNQKGVSSMKLHRDLGIPQTIAWHLAHRIRKAWETDHGPYEGSLEIDESYFGGKERNKTESRKGSPKTIVVGAKDRVSNQITASVVPDRKRATLAPFINPLLDEGTTVGVAIGALLLPRASGGNGSLTYSLTPSIPGLSFDQNSRTLTGTPTTAGTYDMTYQVQDGDANAAASDAATLTFTVNVQPPSSLYVGCSAAAETWRGLRVCTERPRDGYDRDDYGTGYRSLEDDIIAAFAGDDEGEWPSVYALLLHRIRNHTERYRCD